jgi:two-component system cell cycle response regulator
MKRILIVSSDREEVAVLSQWVSYQGNAIQVAPDSESALHRLRAWKPHVMFIDLKLPELLELDLIAKVRLNTPDDYPSLLVLLPVEASLEVVQKIVDSGADEYVLKPLRQVDFVPRFQLLIKMKETHDSLRRASHRIEELSSTDDLTGLMNMRALFRKGEEELSRSVRFRKPVSSVLINLDGFTGVNQSYGFLVGSAVLQETARRIKKCVRQVDLVSRVGADEFFVFLNETDLGGAEFIAERIRDAIQSEPYKGEKTTVSLTATLGVAGLTSEQTNQRMADLLHLTTEALKSAKANGANRIEVYSFT